MKKETTDLYHVPLTMKLYAKNKEQAKGKAELLLDQLETNKTTFFINNNFQIIINDKEETI
jgi:sulfur carrier protein ThiS